MDVSEKLVDDVHSKLMGLLQRAPYIRCEDVHRQYAVNWLMNNGVTVQEWISVKDRLPKEEEKVLIYTKTGTVHYGTYTKRYSFYCTEGFICSDGFVYLRTASHWQPMPQPPKGE